MQCVIGAAFVSLGQVLRLHGNRAGVKSHIFVEFGHGHVGRLAYGSWPAISPLPYLSIFPFSMRLMVRTSLRRCRTTLSSLWGAKQAPGRRPRLLTPRPSRVHAHPHTEKDQLCTKGRTNARFFFEIDGRSFETAGSMLKRWNEHSHDCRSSVVSRTYPAPCMRYRFLSSSSTMRHAWESLAVSLLLCRVVWRPWWRPEHAAAYRRSFASSRTYGRQKICCDLKNNRNS